MLGADGPGKAEAELDAIERCRLFCDEWAQASHGGELTGAVKAGRITREDVTELGAVLTGKAEGRTSPDEMTLFDSTGLAIQDLALCHAVLEAAPRRSRRSVGQRHALTGARAPARSDGHGLAVRSSVAARAVPSLGSPRSARSPRARSPARRSLTDSHRPGVDDSCYVSTLASAMTLGDCQHDPAAT